MWGAWWAGLVAVPLNAKLHPLEVRHCLDDAEAAVCLTDDETTQALRSVSHSAAVVSSGESEWNRLVAEPSALEEPEAVSKDALAWIFYTSGTTGRPKGAMLSHRNLRVQSDNYYVDIDEVDAEDAILHAAPLSHGSGLYAIPFVSRGSLQVLPPSGGFSVAEVHDALQQRPARSVHMFAVPTMVARLVGGGGPAGSADRPALAAVKTIAYGGGPMYVADLQRAMRVLGGGRLVQLYGQAEAPMTITALSKGAHDDPSRARWHERLASVGVARDGVDVRVVGRGGEALPSGEVGEVVCRGAVVMLGYWRNEAATAAAIDGDGWLATGDLGYLDDDGYLFLKDRSKDVVISGGSNVYPREVEEVLLMHEDVAECAVIGRPHAEWGEEVVAFVVPRSQWRALASEASRQDGRAGEEEIAEETPRAAGSLEEEEEGKAKLGAELEAELNALCLERIARFKRPRAYVLLDELPKNNNGKVLKTALRKRLGVQHGVQK